MVVPEENWAYRTVAGGGTTTSPALAQRFPYLGRVGEVMRACLKDPAAQFDLAAPRMLLDNVVRNLPAERRNGPVTGANATTHVTADVKVSEIAAAELTRLDQLGLLHPSGIPPGRRFHLDPCESVESVQRRIRETAGCIAAAERLDGQEVFDPGVFTFRSSPWTAYIQRASTTWGEAVCGPVELLGVCGGC